MDGKDEGSLEMVAPVAVDLSRGGAAADLTGKVHQLPCCIKHDGPTPVSHYIKPKPTEMEVDGLKVEEAHFRGRKLHGTTVALPRGYSGFILGKKGHDQGNNGTNSQCWETAATFEDITIWTHDAIPSKDDAFLRAFHWFTAANALHQTVTAEDLESACID
ncbi:ribonuclease H2 subunit C-like [Salvia splendens]|uniref:ribonuclease H2 subunit C-like n=1 Tax=Salvia splendens TaxID=180675 RepID=UPI001C25F2E6|nr:ribonuclease H2 subunit C-like [Salvia splendens]